jgi:hypothetical protein
MTPFETGRSGCIMEDLRNDRKPLQLVETHGL